MSMNTEKKVNLIEEVLEEYCQKQQDKYSYDDCEKHCLMFDKEKRWCRYNEVIDFISSLRK